jgi:hypothetical protein
MGFERRKSHGLNGWICIPINPQDFVDQRKRMAMHSEKADATVDTLENKGVQTDSADI